MDYLKENYKQILVMAAVTYVGPVALPAGVVKYIPVAKDVFDVARAWMVKGSMGAGKKVGTKLFSRVMKRVNPKNIISANMLLRSGLEVVKKKVGLGGGRSLKESVDRVKELTGYRNWLKLKDEPDFQARAAMPQYQEPSSWRGLIKWKIALHDWDYAPFGEYKDAEARRAKKKELISQIKTEHKDFFFPQVQVADYDYLSDKQVRSAYERLGVRKWGDMTSDEEDFYASDKDEKVSYADAVRPKYRGSDSTIEL